MLPLYLFTDYNSCQFVSSTMEDNLTMLLFGYLVSRLDIESDVFLIAYRLHVPYYNSSFEHTPPVISYKILT